MRLDDLSEGVGSSGLDDELRVVGASQGDGGEDCAPGVADAFDGLKEK